MIPIAIRTSAPLLRLAAGQCRLSTSRTIETVSKPSWSNQEPIASSTRTSNDGDPDARHRVIANDFKHQSDETLRLRSAAAPPKLGSEFEPTSRVMSRPNLPWRFAGRGLARALARVDPRNSMARAAPKAWFGTSNQSVTSPNRRYAPLRGEEPPRFRFGSRFALHRSSIEPIPRFWSS